MKLTKTITLIFLCQITACDLNSPDTAFFNSSDEALIEHVKKELTKEGIEYTEEVNGVIVVKIEDEIFIDSARDKYWRSERVKFSDADEQKNFIKVLDSMSVDYSVLNEDDGIWVKWWPLNEKHKKEIMQKVEKLSRPSY